MLRQVSLLCLLLISSVTNAEPGPRKVIDRVVAVVDDEIITLVELRERGKPMFVQLARLTDAERPIAEAQMYRDLVDKMIDERVVGRWAHEHFVKVEPSEIDAALELVAKQNNITRAELFKAAEAQRLGEAAYREELQRQILQQKVAQKVVYTRARKEHAGASQDVILQAMDRAMRVWMNEQRREIFVEVRL